MPAVEKFSIALTPEMAKEVKGVVHSGEYASNSEVIREALRDWHRKRVTQQREIEEIRALWREGIESGPGRYSSMSEIKLAARKRLAQSDE